MTRYLTLAALLLVVIYGLIEAWPLIIGPMLSVESPADNATIEDGIVTVSGHVERASLFTLNGAPLLQDQSGGFSSTLTFPHGGSILTFVATDRFGRSITERRTVFVPY
jgi:hypothetical protein